MSEHVQGVELPRYQTTGHSVVFQCLVEATWWFYRTIRHPPDNLITRDEVIVYVRTCPEKNEWGCCDIYTEGGSQPNAWKNQVSLIHSTM